MNFATAFYVLNSISVFDSEAMSCKVEKNPRLLYSFTTKPLMQQPTIVGYENHYSVAKGDPASPNEYDQGCGYLTRSSKELDSPCLLCTPHAIFYLGLVSFSISFVSKAILYFRHLNYCIQIALGLGMPPIRTNSDAISILGSLKSSIIIASHAIFYLGLVEFAIKIASHAILYLGLVISSRKIASHAIFYLGPVEFSKRSPRMRSSLSGSLTLL